MNDIQFTKLNSIAISGRVYCMAEKGYGHVDFLHFCFQNITIGRFPEKGEDGSGTSRSRF